MGKLLSERSRSFKLKVLVSILLLGIYWIAEQMSKKIRVSKTIKLQIVVINDINRNLYTLTHRQIFKNWR